MTEPVVIWRGGSTTGTYGETIHGDPVPWATIDALVAPNHPEEPNEVGRQAVITGFTIYHRTPTETGILPTDLVELRSPAPADDIEARRRHLVPINGQAGVWRRDGRVVGEQFAVKVVTG